MKQTCGDITSLYCASWTCVTTNDGEWKWATTPWYISMSFVKPCTRTRYSADCNLVCIKFKKAAKSDGRWMSGLIWGLYLHQKPLFRIPIQIRLAVSPASAPVSIGQNPVLPEARPPQPEAPQGPQPKAPQGTTLPLSSPGLGDRLLNLIKGLLLCLEPDQARIHLLLLAVPSDSPPLL